MENKKIIDQLYNKILQFCAKGGNNEYNDCIYKQLQIAVKNNDTVNLVIFTCSTISSRYLFSKKPWLYVNTKVEGNNLESDLSKLCLVMRALRKIYPKMNLKILIGNTDPYYIYYPPAILQA